MRLPSCPNGHPLAHAGARFCGVCGAEVEVTVDALPLGAVETTPVAAVAPVGPLSGARCAVHPERGAVLVCGRCGNFACADCQIADTGICQSCTRRTKIPWDERDLHGTWVAFWRTSTAMLRQPRVTLAQAGPEGTLGSSFLFALIAQGFALSGMLAIYALLFFGVGGALLPSDRGSAAVIASIGVGILALLVVLGPIAGAVGTLAGAFFDHLALRLIGAQPKSFEVTFRAAALAQAPALVGLIPICGLYAIPIWTLVLKVLAYQRLHGISTGKALVGALMVPVVLFVLGGVGYFLTILFLGAGLLS